MLGRCGRIFFAIVLAGLVSSQVVIAATLKQDTPSAQNLYIVDIALDDLNIPFLLDNKGHVWAFKKPLSREGLFRLQHLNNIKMIAPWIALQNDGRVLTWFLDKDTRILGNEDVIAAYSTPKPMEGLSNVTHIAKSIDRFVVVRDDKEILEWSEVESEEGFGLKGYTPIKKLYMREGIKDIAVTSYSTLALFKDGTILGWGINEFGVSNKDLSHRQVSFHAPEALAVFLSYKHAVALLKDGRTLFWGGCNTGDIVSSSIFTSEGVTSSLYGQVSDVITMAMPGNDDSNPNVFVKRDGTVWRAYAPFPPVIKQCGNDMGSVERVVQLTGMTAPAMAIRANSISVLALGEDNTVWIASNAFLSKDHRMKKINIDLKED